MLDICDRKGDCLLTVLMLNDSTFIIASTSTCGISGDKTVPLFDTNPNPNNWEADLWIMKYQVTTVNGINEIEQPQFTIYPNPAKDLLYVSPKKSLPANSSMCIIDMQGRVIEEENISRSNSSVIPIHVSSLSQGVYLIKLKGMVKRFVKM